MYVKKYNQEKIKTIFYTNDQIIKEYWFNITPTIKDIESVHKIIRDTLCDMGYFDIPILYGASVNANNSGEIMSIPNVDGVLVGGASLKIDDFIPIIKSVK